MLLSVNTVQKEKTDRDVPGNSIFLKNLCWSGPGGGIEFDTQVIGV